MLEIVIEIKAKTVLKTRKFEDLKIGKFEDWEIWRFEDLKIKRKIEGIGDKEKDWEIEK